MFLLALNRNKLRIITRFGWPANYLLLLIQIIQRRLASFFLFFFRKQLFKAIQEGGHHYAHVDDITEADEGGYSVLSHRILAL